MRTCATAPSRAGTSSTVDTCGIGAPRSGATADRPVGHELHGRSVSSPAGGETRESRPQVTGTAVDGNLGRVSCGVAPDAHSDGLSDDGPDLESVGPWTTGGPDEPHALDRSTDDRSDRAEDPLPGQRGQHRRRGVDRGAGRGPAGVGEVQALVGRHHPAVVGMRLRHGIGEGVVGQLGRERHRATLGTGRSVGSSTPGRSVDAAATG